MESNFLMKVVSDPEKTLIELIRGAVRNELSSIKESLSKEPNHPILEFLTRKNAANFLGISLTSLYYLQRQNKIKYYRIGNKIFFKKEDLLAVYVVRGLLTKEEGGCHE